MSELLSKELQNQFIGEEALSVFTDFFEFIGEKNEAFDALSDEQKVLQVLNRIFSDKGIFHAYINFIQEHIEERVFLKKEVFYFVCDYLSDLTIWSVHDIISLPSIEEIESDMNQSKIPGLDISYAEALKASGENNLFYNSRWEIIYFIEEQNDGNLVYSSQGGFHLVNDTGGIILHEKGENILGKILISKIRSYKEILAYLSRKVTTLSWENKEILGERMIKKSDINIKNVIASEAESKLLIIKLRFSFSTDVARLEGQFRNYREEILKVVWGTDFNDGNGERRDAVEVSHNRGLIRGV